MICAFQYEYGILIVYGSRFKRSYHELFIFINGIFMPRKMVVILKQRREFSVVGDVCGHNTQLQIHNVKLQK